MSEDELPPSPLGEECSHHCGVMMTGSVQYVGHCACPECHDIPKKYIKGQPMSMEAVGNE